MLHESVLSLRIPGKPETLDYCWLGLLHGLGLLASVYNSLPIAIRIGLLIVVSTSWIRTIIRYRAIDTDYLEIELRHGDQWVLREHDGQQQKARLLPSTVNTARIVLLHLDLGSAGKRYLMIRRHQIDPELFRQLRVVLKISPATD